MFKRQKAPLLTNSKIKVGIAIAKGQKTQSKPVKKVFVRSKIPFKGLIKNLNRKSNFQRYTPEKIAIIGQQAWFAFLKAKLPVPKISKLDLRKNSKYYLHLFVEDLRKRHGELIDCHTQGDPTFFKRLLIPRDRIILKKLAGDLSKIHSLGFAAENVDFWHFYRKKNTWDRVIIDFDGFRKQGKARHQESVFENIYDIGTNLGTKSKEFRYFIHDYTKNCNNKIIRDLILKQYNIDKFEYLDPRFMDQ